MEEELRLSRPGRFGIVLLGLIAWLAMAPAGLVAFMAFFGFHGRPRYEEWGWEDWTGAGAAAAMVLLFFLLGLAALFCTTRRRLGLVAAIAGAILLDIALALTCLQVANRRDDARSYAIPAPPPAAGRMRAVDGARPVSVGIACSAASDDCYMRAARAAARARPSGFRRNRSPTRSRSRSGPGADPRRRDEGERAERSFVRRSHRACSAVPVGTQAGLNFIAAPFMQYRFPVGRGPSSKT